VKEVGVRMRDEKCKSEPLMVKIQLSHPMNNPLLVNDTKWQPPGEAQPSSAVPLNSSPEDAESWADVAIRQRS